MRLLSLLHAHPFFQGKTVSTGREEFGVQMADKILEFGKTRKVNADDLLATASELTACSIASKVGPLLDETDEAASLYLTGGGSRNRFFVKRLRELLPGTEVKSIRVLNADPLLVEAMSYAVLGDCCLHGEGVNGSQISRSKQKPVPGYIVQPPKVK